MIPDTRQLRGACPVRDLVCPKRPSTAKAREPTRIWPNSEEASERFLNQAGSLGFCFASLAGGAGLAA